VNAEVLNQRSLSLIQSFGVAAILIVAGVLSTWIVLKQSGEAGVLNFPVIQFIEPETPSVATGQATESWLQSGDDAYAAGRITSPPADNALYYFEKALAESPGSTAAQAGLERVVKYLRAGIESSIYRGDWSTARDQIAQIQDIHPDDVESRLLVVRIDRFEQIENLLIQADRQIAASRLTAPDGDNAVTTYQAVLEIDPNNAQALQGIDSITERLLSIAQSAALAGEQSKARRFIEKARSANPSAPGLVQAEQLVGQWHKLVSNQQIKDQLEAASAALQVGRLAGNGQDNALALFDAVLESEPDSEAARQGKKLVLKALIEQSWTAVRAGRFDAASDATNQAEAAGGDPVELSRIREEINYQQSLSKARAGKFDKIYGINEFEVRRREIPEYPRLAEGNGWVTVRYTVSEKGDVVDAVAFEASDQIFVEAALNAIYRWRFKPMKLNDRPIPARGVVRFAFEE
jgi:TonB family protein